MRLEFASGEWVELRTKLKARDLFAVRQTVAFTYQDGSMNTNFDAGIMDQMRNALLSRIILAWSYDFPIPDDSPMGPDIIGEAMDLDDYVELEKEVEPLMAKVGFGSANETTPASGASS